MQRRNTLLVLLSLLLALLTGCRSEASRPPNGAAVQDTTELQAAFNADIGHVRVVVLASPT